MKILITGAQGQLGYNLQQELSEDELFLGDRHNFDITNRDQVRQATEQFGPEVIIHAAAYTQVDKAESEQEICRAINVEGTRHVVEAAQSVGAKLVTISTDYVFAGDQNSPYVETDTPNPLSFYGQTKLEAEQLTLAYDRSFVARISWLYGGPLPGPEVDLAALPFKNFVTTMLKVGKLRDMVEVVSDQIGQPTYAKDVAKTLEALIQTDHFGIYHLTNSDATNWAEFAETIFEKARYSTTVNYLTSQEWQAKNPTSTRRPAYSVLAHTALQHIGLQEPRPWTVALDDFMQNYNQLSKE